MGTLPCDDGNTRDGDGCSAECYVEPEYECTGGSAVGPDICIERRKPEIRLFRYFANRSAFIVFSERVIINGFIRYNNK